MAASTPAETTSRWARRFVLTSAAFLVAFAVADLSGAGRRTLVLLGLFGFVFHTVFGKAYSLLPSYFDRQLVSPRGMPVHLALTAGGTGSLTITSIADRTPTIDAVAVVGAAAWLAGVALFVATIGWTVRDNLTGRDTGTGDVNAERGRVDRVANAAAPVALGYLVLGSYGVLAHYASLSGPFGYFPTVSHLLGAGTATLLLLGVGFRLLPRFLVVQARPGVAVVIVLAGTIGPLLLAFGLARESVVRYGGALLQTVAVVGFAAAYGSMFSRSDRRRVGLYGVLVGAAAGAITVLLGADMALGRGDLRLAAIHVRLNVIGFLGLAIVGVTYQFYPPTAGRFRFATNRTAYSVIACLGGGLLLQLPAGIAVVGREAPAASSLEAIALLGRFGVLLGAVVHAWLLLALFRDRYGSG